LSLAGGGVGTSAEVRLCGTVSESFTKVSRTVAPAHADLTGDELVGRSGVGADRDLDHLARRLAARGRRRGGLLAADLAGRTDPVHGSSGDAADVHEPIRSGDDVGHHAEALPDDVVGALAEVALRGVVVDQVREALVVPEVEAGAVIGMPGMPPARTVIEMRAMAMSVSLA